MQPMKPMQPMEPMKFEHTARWWPDALGQPDSSGGQNDVEYAYFSEPRRLLIRRGAEVATYDTGTHRIQDISQASDAAHARFSSDQGPVELAQLKRL